MIRQRQRKTVEDLYGSKFDASKSHVTATQLISGRKPNRVIERDNHYVTPGNEPILSHNAATIEKSINPGKETSRRKSGRASNKFPNEKHCPKEIFTNDEVKTRSAINSMQVEKFIVYDNKNCGNYKEMPKEDACQTQQYKHQRHHHHHQHQHQHDCNHNRPLQVHDDDKDVDDTDEFFDLIRHTVENAVGKSTELLNRNFRELSSKMDRFAEELKNTNMLLNQLQNEMENKISHYGEENSRHFRYLCMKSEYDKMFYQHQTLIANIKPPNVDISTSTKSIDKQKKSSKSSGSTTKMQRKDSFPCVAVKKSKSKSTPRAPEEDHTRSPENISQKSSDIGMREVLEQIKLFCSQRQFNNLERGSSGDGPGTSRRQNATIRSENFIQMYKEAFQQEDDGQVDEWDVSSDGMTPRNISTSSKTKYGDGTSRGGSTQRKNNELGDA